MVRASFLLVASLLVAVPAVAEDARPRVAVVLKGDPNAEVVATARGLSEALEARGEVVQPTDATARAALLGATSETEDGLENVRAARRGLGWDEARDVESLTRLGAFFECDALVVVRAGAPATAEVFDVARHDFYDGIATLDDPTFERPSRFVRARARAARERRNAAAASTAAAATSPVATATASATSPTEPSPPTTLAAATAGSETDDRPPARRFFRRNWPWFVAGALFAGAITWVVISQTGQDDAPAPVIHVRPGGGG